MDISTVNSMSFVQKDVKMLKMLMSGVLTYIKMIQVFVKLLSIQELLIIKMEEKLNYLLREELEVLFKIII
jgi:hypothetical protein